MSLFLKSLLVATIVFAGTAQAQVKLTPGTSVTLSVAEPTEITCEAASPGGKRCAILTSNNCLNANPYGVFYADTATDILGRCYTFEMAREVVKTLKMTGQCN